MGTLATHASLQLARFDRLTTMANGLNVSGMPGVLFGVVGSDNRAAATEVGALHAYTFALLGLHENADSASAFINQTREVAPWLASAREHWTSVLRPFRHRGSVNYLSYENPGLIFSDVENAASPN